MIGGGDSAVEEAVYLTQFASEVVIVHRRDELRAQKSSKIAHLRTKISFVWDTITDEIIGNDMVVTGVKGHNAKTGEEIELAADGVFIYVGLDPLTEPFRKAGLTNLCWLDSNRSRYAYEYARCVCYWRCTRKRSTPNHHSSRRWRDCWTTSV